MNTLITSDNTWALMSIMCGSVAVVIYLEQHFTWAAKISGTILCLVAALAFSNLRIIPTSAPIYDDVVWGFVVPMAIPLLLMQCNIKKIWKESGRLLLLFFIGSIGTCCGALLGAKLLGGIIPELNSLAAIMTGSYIGGTVNFTALSESFPVAKDLIGATIVADNLLMAVYIFVLIAIPSFKFFRKHFTHPHVDAVERAVVNAEGKTQAAAYWERKPISLRDIAMNFALSIIIVTVSIALGQLFGRMIPTSNTALTMMNTLLSNKYLIITTISMLIATFCPKQIENISGSQEMGTYLIYLFFFVIGVPASIVEIFKNAPMMLVFCALMIAVNMMFCFIFGKLLKFDLEDIILASNANIGGPTTAAAMAVSKGWTTLVGPIMLIGTVGYVVGTYFGILVANILM